ncbi:HAD-IIB family hydrolase [Salinicoccus hispanicus]|uniref:HAD-IIB family hydrolase n=1 Tax=Salinicoccus hispanicus TaxID=157225 RepID=A0A6N8TZB8_9STAP|nr:HAD-IIB family hydrolase [Salinicoccus hispanicus]MXQ51184.1 HAD-IIB family hydrolase [Salinicoccus hispanicus]
MKALALDMDGTILDHSGNFPESLVETLIELKSRGFLIFFATGRTPHEITSITPAGCPLDGYVAASGMGIYIDGRLVESASFEPDFVKRMVEEARSKEIYYEIHTLEHSSRTLLQDRTYIFEDLSEEQPETMMNAEYTYAKDTLESTTQWVVDLSFEHVVKMFFFSTNMNKIRNWYDYLENHQDSTIYALYTTSRHNAEIMLNGRDKANGMEVLLDHYDISFRDVHAIGDSMNDLPLFEKAGRSTAMKNAPHAIKEKADDITASTCDENGLERYLRKEYLK